MKSPAKKVAAVKPTIKAPAKTAPAPKSAPKAVKAPAKKPAAPAKKKNAEPPDTFVSAQIDIGFGNHLYVRGEGPGLSWDHGLAMDNTGSNLWTATIRAAIGPVIFKVLVNDLTWNSGPDYIALPGKSLNVTPTF